MSEDVRGDVEKGFRRVSEEFVVVRTEIAAQGVTLRGEISVLRDEMNSGFTDVQAEIRQSADDSRRYFQILTEQIRDSVRVVAEVNAHHASRLDNHETRLTTLEQPNRI